MKGLAAFLVGLVLASPANAYLKAGPAGYGHWLKAATVQDGMGTSLAAAYSFRKLRSAYAGPAVKLRRTTGGTQDINFTAGGDFDTAAAATFCAATTCFLDTWYDQSGLGRHAAQTNPAAQPAFTFNCTGSLPCATAATGQFMQAPDVTPAAGPASFSTVQKVAAAGGLCYGMQAASQLQGINGANVVLYNGAAISQAVSAGAWHVSEGVINTASSVLALDGVEATGTIAPVTTPGPIYTAYNGGPPACNYTEAVWWNNYALTAPERLALQQNQQQYWAPLPLDTFATPAGAYSMRRLKSGYAGPAIRLRRASDNAEQDINFLGFTGFTGAPLDTAAAGAFCAATSCFIRTWYDQSGNARDVGNATPAAQVSFVFNCVGGLPCAQGTGAAQTGLGTGSIAWVAGKTTTSVVANRGAGAGSVWLALKGGNGLQASSATTDWWYTDQTVGGYVWPAANNVWHAGVGTMDGAASAGRVDATDFAGANVPGSAAAGSIFLLVGAAATTASLSEVVLWDNYAVTQPERVTLTTNQRNFWGLP